MRPGQSKQFAADTPDTSGFDERTAQRAKFRAENIPNDIMAIIKVNELNNKA